MQVQYILPLEVLPVSGKIGPFQWCDWGRQNWPSMGIHATGGDRFKKSSFIILSSRLRGALSEPYHSVKL
jgi:hypothetical protein